MSGLTILGASDKAGAKLPVVGGGDHMYEVHHDWGELPESISLGQLPWSSR